MMEWFSIFGTEKVFTRNEKCGNGVGNHNQSQSKKVGCSRAVQY
jgi:hypothetical protein